MVRFHYTSGQRANAPERLNIYISDKLEIPLILSKLFSRVTNISLVHGNILKFCFDCTFIKMIPNFDIFVGTKICR